MINPAPCPHCGRVIPRQAGPNPRCPACREALAVPAAPSPVLVPAGDFEELELGPEPDAAPPPRPRPVQTRPGVAVAEPPAPRRPPSESSLAASRMAHAPTFKSTKKGSSLSLLPIVAGVILTLAITVFALTRGRPAAPPPVAPRSAEPPVTTIGRPPVADTPAVAEPEPPAPVVTRDLPTEPPPVAREKRKAAEREPAARPARPTPPREVARAEKPAAATRTASAAPAPVPTPVAAAAVAAEPAAPAPAPLLAAQPPPSASAPMTISAAGAREGYQKARQVRPGCVASSLRLPRDTAGVEGESALVKFQVDESGAVSDFTYLSGPTDQRIASAIWTAVQRCEWAPGVTAQGRPITLWVTLPIKFGK